MKFALVAFRGDPVCAVHVFLNAMDMKERGHAVMVVLEGQATALIKDLRATPGSPLEPLFQKTRGQGIDIFACRACSQKTGSIEAMTRENVPLLGEMNGHPSLARLREEGYEVMMF